MNLNQATIKIKNLRLRTYIGINDDEIKNKQDVVVNVTIHYDAGRATDSDSATNPYILLVRISSRGLMLHHLLMRHAVSDQDAR